VLIVGVNSGWNSGERMQKAWLGPRNGVYREKGMRRGLDPSQKKMKFSFELIRILVNSERNF